MAEHIHLIWENPSNLPWSPMRNTQSPVLRYLAIHISRPKFSENKSSIRKLPKEVKQKSEWRRAIRKPSPTDQRINRIRIEWNGKNSFVKRSPRVFTKIKHQTDRKKGLCNSFEILHQQVSWLANNLFRKSFSGILGFYKITAELLP